MLPELVIDVEAYTEVSAYLSHSIQRHPHRPLDPRDHDVHRLDALSLEAVSPIRGDRVGAQHVGVPGVERGPAGALVVDTRWINEVWEWPFVAVNTWIFDVWDSTPYGSGSI